MTDAIDITAAPAPEKKPFYRVLYVQVLFAIVLGVLVGSQPRSRSSIRVSCPAWPSCSASTSSCPNAAR